MRFDARLLWGVVGGVMVLGITASKLLAADAYPVFTQIDSTVGHFGSPWSGPFGAYAVNNSAMLNGNRVASITQNAMAACCHGASVVVAVSNGENGDNGSPDMVTINGVTGPNMDAPNATPANSVFNAIGNSSGKLENGNVVRLSAWFRSDPARPITAEPQVAPILKIEYWKEPFTAQQDTNATQVAPNFGDRLFDQDQQGYALTIPDPPAYVDINNDGTVVHDDGFPPKASSANGRLFGLATDHWTLASVTHKVNVDDFFGIGSAAYGAFSVDKIESIQGVIFLGEFSTTPVTGPGNLLVDNILIEVFKDAASVTPLANPDPALSEIVGLPGDFNNNHFVDAADYTVWRDHLGAGDESSLNGNGNGMNGVDAGDYSLWKMHFGEHSPGAGSLAGGTVPEPTSALLLAIALVGMLGRSWN